MINRILRALKVLMFTAFALNIAMLLISLSAAWLNPRYFWPPAFIKLFFPGWMLVNFLFLVAFILLNQKRGIAIALITFALCITSVFKLVGFHFRHSGNGGTEGRHLRVMTYNVAGFDSYVSKKEALVILKNIRQQHPDIVCMQEYLMRVDDKFRILDSMVNNYGYRYYKEHILVTTNQGYYFGMAIFSKYPLKNFNSIPFDNSIANGGCFVDVHVGESAFRLLNIHFQSFALAQREYVMEDYNERGRISRFRLFRITLNKMRRAFRKKSFQTGEVDSVINNSPYPVILCGDFNDTPLSYTYSRLTEKLKDTYLGTNFGLGTTFAGNLPYLRIDYILAGDKLKPVWTKVIKKKASDHFPLVCDFRLD